MRRVCDDGARTGVSSSRADSESDPAASALGLPASLVLLMAIATGTAVANIYYAQPLLDTLGRSFDVPIHSAGLLVTVTQLGYLAGLVLVVPLGDLLERRRLVVVVTLFSALSLVIAATAGNALVFALASWCVGVTAVAAQILVPYAAHLAAPQARGRVVGRVMSGLLLGILLARTVAGFVSDLWGWRSMFWIAAAVMLVQAWVLASVLPRDRSGVAMRYGQLLRSVWQLIREQPVLRRRMVYGALMFATFSVLWTALPFLLARPPYEFSDGVIGSFGLAGVAGVVAASFAGRLHDGGANRRATGGFIVLVAAAFALMGLWPHALAVLVAAVVLLDTGVQGTQILNQSAIYELDPNARSRITTAYMSGYFAGGAAGSALAAFAYSVGGWSAVAGAGLLLPLVALLYWWGGRSRP